MDVRFIGVLITFFVQAPAWGLDLQGTMQLVQGDVKVKSSKSGQITPAQVHQQVSVGDTVITQAAGRVQIEMSDGNVLHVDSGSNLEIQEYHNDDEGKKVLLNLIRGRVRAQVKMKYDHLGDRFELTTPAAVTGVRGTDFLTEYNEKENTTRVVTFKGEVEFGTRGPDGRVQKSVRVSEGKTSRMIAGNMPSEPKAAPKKMLQRLERRSKVERTKAEHEKKEYRKKERSDKRSHH